MITDAATRRDLAFTGNPVSLAGMKRKPTTVSPEDAELFREAIGEVRRIETEAAAGDRPRPPPEPKRLKIDESEALRESRDLAGSLPPLDGAELQNYRRPEIPERTLRQLRRGEFSVQDEIDLHSLRASDAELVLKRFLNEARSGMNCCVRIVHGKGLRSGPGGPVLKVKLNKWLPQWDQVLAFTTAPARDGGTGALYVLLAR